jgi:GTP-binding protein
MKRRAVEILAISALTSQGVSELLYRAAQLLEEASPEPEREEVAIFRLPEEELTVHHENGGFRVRGKRAERAVAMTDWRYREAIEKLHRELEAMGVTQALEEAGVQPGHTVYIGDMELEWWV